MKNQLVLKHIGINAASPEEAEQLVRLLPLLFNLEPRHGQKSKFVSSYFEYIKWPLLGSKEHIAMHTEDLQGAVEELKEKGSSFRMETAAYFEDGSTRNVHLDGEYGGFAIHVMQK